MEAVQPNFDAWYTADEACQRLGGVTSKTLNTYVRDGANISGRNYKIGKAERSIPGRRPMPVYSPEDVDAIAKLRPKQVVPLMGGGGDLIPSPSGPAGPAALFGALAEAFQSVKPSKSVFVTVPEAARLAGLSKDMILRLARSGKIEGTNRGRWRLLRSSVLELGIDDIESLPREPKKGKKP